MASIQIHGRVVARVATTIGQHRQADLGSNDADVQTYEASRSRQQRQRPLSRTAWTRRLTRLDCAGPRNAASVSDSTNTMGTRPRTRANSIRANSTGSGPCGTGSGGHGAWTQRSHQGCGLVVARCTRTASSSSCDHGTRRRRARLVGEHPRSRRVRIRWAGFRRATPPPQRTTVAQPLSHRARRRGTR